MTNARIVIMFLGATLVISMLGLVWLSHDGISVPDVLVAIPSGAMGALSAFLVKSSGEEPSPVTVQAPSTVQVQQDH